MIAKIGENSYVDVDSISAITGNYGHKDSTKWTTIVVMGSSYGTFNGQEGKNLMDAYLWARKTAIHDMRPESENYRKVIKGEK